VVLADLGVLVWLVSNLYVGIGTYLRMTHMTSDSPSHPRQ